MSRFKFTCVCLALASALCIATAATRVCAADARVLSIEAQRIAAIDKVAPTVVAIFSPGGQGGGSGVLVTRDGFALSNFHVVQGAGPVMKCGLPDGILYDAVLVGLDKVGDVALIKLLPQEKGKDFPVAVMADSDRVQAGDWSLALGNPFLLATDFKPTVTFGLVSGVHRYQYPAGTLLEYTDCIQVDTSINPGNSGGPLFNMDGELIGINGRGSFDKRGRVNSGVGYAISINQIKNFMPHLKAGIDTDHATLGALIQSDTDEGEGNRLLVRSIIEESDAHRRGLDVDDELVSFAGRPTLTVNQYKNVLGLYPKDWRLPLVYRRNNAKHEILVRLMKLQRQQQLGLEEDGPRRPNPQQPQPPRPKVPETPATKLYEPKLGYANYYFNKLERDRVLAAAKKHGDFSPLTGEWKIEGEFDNKQRRAPFTFVIAEEYEQPTASGKPVVREWTYHLNAKALPPLPDGAKDDESPLRTAVRKAAAAMQKHAESFPQEVWARDTDAEFKQSVAALTTQVGQAHKDMVAALDELKKVDKAKETSRVWQAHYDFYLARLTAFVAYSHEYQALLAQLVGDKPPPRDPAKHRAWRMVSEEKIQAGGDEAKKHAAAAETVWQKMTKDYADTIWEDRANEGLKINLGLKWQPSGGLRSIVRFDQGLTVHYELDPLKVGQEVQNLKNPPGSGGLMTALYQLRRLLVIGPSGFEGNFSHGGQEPYYPTQPDLPKGQSWKDVRVDAEVIHTEHGAVGAKWYFSVKDHMLLGGEVAVDHEDDPCEVYLSDYRAVAGRQLPHRLEVRYGNTTYGVFTVKSYQLAAAK